MNNITLEDLYKKAVIKQYEEVKNGEDYIYLNSPTRGKLNKLCWEIFETKNVSKDDEVVFNTLLGFPFDLNTKNKFRSNTNQFRPVETFLKGETDPDKIEVVDLAAILVDFKYRPFGKFRKEHSKEEEELIRELRDTNFPNGLSEETKDIDINKEEPKNESNENLTLIPQPPITTSPQKPKRTLAEIISKYSKSAIINTTLLFFAIIAVVYFAFFNKHCMQWSEDHYDIVDCSSKDNGNLNEIIPYDENLVDFRKLKACDTTTCFRKNGEAFVWYGKTSEGVDFFNDNGNGRHPETNGALRPVTHYMFGKYLKGKPCK